MDYGYVSPQGRLLFFCAIAALALLIPAISSQAQTVLYSDLDAGNSYVTNTGWYVSGASSLAPVYFSRGIPFTISSSATLSSLSLGLGLDFGTNQVTVELEGNSPFNLPNGTILASGTVAAAAQAGTSSTALTTFTPTGPPVALSAGTTYWVVALPGAADTYAEWNLVSTMGNTASSNNGTSYTQQNGVNLGALVVNGFPAPEPQSAALWALGTASVLARFRPRRD